MSSTVELNNDNFAKLASREWPSCLPTFCCRLCLLKNHINSPSFAKVGVLPVNEIRVKLAFFFQITLQIVEVHMKLIWVLALWAVGWLAFCCFRIHSKPSFSLALLSFAEGPKSTWIQEENRLRDSISRSYNIFDHRQKVSSDLGWSILCG